ncbi:hypothetical protein HDV00_012041 [Rhizophlyctis rosea]|nr:hypothetical protein HDV00_012041 [Rhizophlyctis rosea]
MIKVDPVELIKELLQKFDMSEVSESSSSAPSTETESLLEKIEDVPSYLIDVPFELDNSPTTEADMLTAVLGVIDDVNEEDKRQKDLERQEQEFVKEHMKRQKYINRHSWNPFKLGGGIANWGISPKSSFLPGNEPPTYPTKPRKSAATLNRSSLDKQSPPTSYHKRSSTVPIPQSNPYVFDYSAYPSPPSSPKKRSSRMSGMFETINAPARETQAPRRGSLLAQYDEENMPLGEQVRRASIDNIPRPVHLYHQQPMAGYPVMVMPQSPVASNRSSRRMSMFQSMSSPSLPLTNNVPITSMYPSPPSYDKSSDDDHTPLAALVPDNSLPRRTRPRRHTSANLPTVPIKLMNPALQLEEPQRRSVSFDIREDRDDAVPLAVFAGRRSLDEGRRPNMKGGYVAQWLKATTIPEGDE